MFVLWISVLGRFCCAHRLDEGLHPGSILDALALFDATADIDRVGTNAMDCFSNVLHGQATTQNGLMREFFWNERPIKYLSTAAIAVHPGIEQKTRKKRRCTPITICVF